MSKTGSASCVVKQQGKHTGGSSGTNELKTALTATSVINSSAYDAQIDAVTNANNNI